jgi:transcription elongation factor B subunit 1
MADKKLTEYVTLVSCDGFEFIVRRSAATIAKTINRMLDPASTSLLPFSCRNWNQNANEKFTGGFSEAIEGRCYFESIR